MIVDKIGGIAVVAHQDEVSTTDDTIQLIEVRQTKSAGLGVFARVTIPRSTRILCTPLLLRLNGGENPREILGAFDGLSAKDQALYLDLYPFVPPVRKELTKRYMGMRWEKLSEREKKVIGIYDANSFEVGIFFLPSRINHSCIPNVHYEFNPILQRGTFHAIHDIEEGEELLISYINGGSRLRAQRQPKLDMWGFVCKCAACQDDNEGRKREERRKEMFELDQKLACQGAYGTEMKSIHALEAATKLASLQVQEGIFNRELSVSYHDAVKYSLEVKNVKMALLWAEKELNHERICLGEDHPIFEAVLARVALLRDVNKASTSLNPSLLQAFQ